jgi:hypothetical protein
MNIPPKLMIAECIHCKKKTRAILNGYMFKAKCLECGAPVILIKKIKDLGAPKEKLDG